VGYAQKDVGHPGRLGAAQEDATPEDREGMGYAQEDVERRGRLGYAQKAANPSSDRDEIDVLVDLVEQRK